MEQPLSGGVCRQRDGHDARSPLAPQGPLRAGSDYTSASGKGIVTGGTTGWWRSRGTAKDTLLTHSLC